MKVSVVTLFKNAITTIGKTEFISLLDTEEMILCFHCKIEQNNMSTSFNMLINLQYHGLLWLKIRRINQIVYS